VDNEKDGQDTNPQANKLSEPWRYRLIAYIERKLHEREAKKKEERPTDKAARRTATATVWIAFFTVVLALVGAMTLIEVLVGGSDTHDIAVATKTQADITKRVTESNFQAICDVRTETSIPENLQTTNIVNRGSVNALNVTAHLEVSRNSLPDLGVIALIEKIDMNEPEILKDKGLPAERITSLHLTEGQRKRILDDQETIVVQGTLDYDNGFGTLKHRQVCFACIADPFQAERQQPPLPESLWTCSRVPQCDNVQRELQNFAAERQRRQQQQSKKPN
jgi:hypothetical protein